MPTTGLLTTVAHAAHRRPTRCPQYSRSSVHERSVWPRTTSARCPMDRRSRSIPVATFATSNVQFANRSALLFGDNSASTSGDDLGNLIRGTNGADLINGFGGNDNIE